MGEQHARRVSQMHEKELWERWARPTFKSLGLDARRVENGLDHGTPDVNYTIGWIELKQLDGWPKRADTIVRVPKLQAHQAAWLLRRWASGGPAWLLLGVGNERLLFAGCDAMRVRHGLRKAELMDIAVWYACAPVSATANEELKHVLLHGYDSLRFRLDLATGG